MRYCVGLLVFMLAPLPPFDQDRAASPAITVPAGTRDAPRIVQITATEDMKFTVTQIDAHPGERIRLVLVAAGNLPKMVMAHNWILLRPDTDPDAFVNAGMLAENTNFIAPDQMDRVLAATNLIAGGESAEVTFTAPAVRGEYPYLCSFRGHYQLGMHGTLAVK